MAGRVEWRTVPGWAFYEVSSEGAVRSYWRGGGVGACRVDHSRAMSLPLTKHGGYPYCKVTDGTNSRLMPVHQMVARAFLGPQPEGLEVAHLDGNPRNNRVGNLAYVTHAENIGHTAIHGTRAVGERCGRSKATEGVIREIRAMHKAGLSYRAIGRLVGLSYATIGDAITGRTWSHVK